MARSATWRRAVAAGVALATQWCGPPARGGNGAQYTWPLIWSMLTKGTSASPSVHAHASRAPEADELARLVALVFFHYVADVQNAMLATFDRVYGAATATTREETQRALTKNLVYKQRQKDDHDQPFKDIDALAFEVMKRSCRENNGWSQAAVDRLTLLLYLLSVYMLNSSEVSKKVREPVVAAAAFHMGRVPHGDTKYKFNISKLPSGLDKSGDKSDNKNLVNLRHQIVSILFSVPLGPTPEPAELDLRRQERRDADAEPPFEIDMEAIFDATELPQEQDRREDAAPARGDDDQAHDMREKKTAEQEPDAKDEEGVARLPSSPGSLVSPGSMDSTEIPITGQVFQSAMTGALMAPRAVEERASPDRSGGAAAVDVAALQAEIAMLREENRRLRAESEEQGDEIAMLTEALTSFLPTRNAA